MRMLLTALSAASALGLAACQQSSSQAEETAPPPKKSLAHQATFYAGQEQLLKIDKAEVKPGASADTLALTVSGQAPGAGYTDEGFVPRIYAAPPPDGVYEVDVVATKPAAGAATPTLMEVKGAWTHYPQARLKGVTFISKTNQVTAMLAPAK